MFFCFGCDEARVLSLESNLTAGCLFSAHAYEAPHLQRVVQRRHACRYFDVRLMHELCDSFSRPRDRPEPDPPVGRGKTYGEQYFPWWCRGLPAVRNY